MTPSGVPGRKERRSGVISTWATNGIGFTCGPSPHNRLPMVLVKVLSLSTTTQAPCQSGLRAASASHGLRPCRLPAIPFIPPLKQGAFWEVSITSAVSHPSKEVA
jgi:hypothetical protein